MVKRVATSIISLAVLMGVLVACGGSDSEVTELQEAETELKSNDSNADEIGREQLLQEILAEPELGISRDLAECFIDYVVDNSPLDFEQWNTLGDDYPVSTETLEGLSPEEMEDLISVVAIGAEDCGLFDEEYEEVIGYPALGRAVHAGLTYNF